ncbi:retrotransposon protein, putative, ty1-copia subclass [Tanacetum coccineum]
MTRKPFPHRTERATDLLGIIHTDVCGPLRHVSRQGASYFITFTDDYGCYGYVYLLKHKHEVFETFKLTPPYTPQHNEVSEMRNHTLLDMVRSMMNLTTLPLSFWDYALETEVEEHSLGDLNEPNNYKAAILDSESDKWVDAMNAEMQSMKYNQVWCLVDLPPNCKTVGSKWSFKKKTDMDGIVHTYKARLVAKAIAAFYDYEIWQMDVKTAFLNGYLNEDIYMVQPESFQESIQASKIHLLMDTSKRGHILVQERLDLNKIQGATTPEDVKRMQNVPYASTVGSIMHVLNFELIAIAMRFETDRDDTKSQTRYVFVLNGGAMDWKGSKQSTTVMSATEAEYIAASEAAMEAVWIMKFISGLVIVATINEPIKMFCDNSAHFLLPMNRGFRGARDTTIEDIIMFATVLNWAKLIF